MGPNWLINPIGPSSPIQRCCSSTLMQPRKKMSRYFGYISCIEGFRHDISWRNIGPTIFWDLSRYIGDLAINRWFFSDISRGQRGSTKVKPATVPVNALQCLPVCLLLRGFEPQTKRFGVHQLTTWAKLPFDI